MKYQTLPFRLRPLLIAGLTSLMLSPHVAASGLSLIPHEPVVSKILYHRDVASPQAMSAIERPSFAVTLADVVKTEHEAATLGFLNLSDFDAAPVQAVSGTTSSATPSVETKSAAIARAKPRATAPAGPDRFEYIKHLPEDIADSVKTLSAHIAKTFKVDQNHAGRVVTTAIKLAAETGLPHTLLLAVVAVESDFRPTARNGNARGLMQIIPFWHPEKVKAVGGPEELMKVDKNMRTGSAILKEYVQRTGSVQKGLRRYNASPHSKQYADKVLKQKKNFESILRSAT